MVTYHEHSQNVDDTVATFKILCLGTSSVGKTSLLRQYVDRTFFPDSCITLGCDIKQKIFTHGNKKYTLKLWDTAGEERFSPVSSVYYRGAHGVAIVYDVTDRNSFEQLNRWQSHLSEYLDYNRIVIMLIGNKIDRRESRCVSMEEGIRQAKKMGALYIECSAMESINVDTAFDSLALHIIENAEQQSAASGAAGNLNLSAQGGGNQANKPRGSCCN